MILAKAIGMALGMLKSGKIGGDLGAIISKDNHILDGHHRVLAAKRSGTDIPPEAIHWTKEPAYLAEARRVNVYSGSKPRSEATY